MNRSTIAPARRSQFFSRGRDMQRQQRLEQMHMRVLPPRQLHLGAPRRELLEEPAMARIGEVRLHRLPGRVGKLDRARIVRRAEVPGEREQHEGVVVGVARIVERGALGRDRAKPAAVRRARGADQKRKTMARGLAERRIAVEHIGVAEHVREARLHQGGAAGAPTGLPSASISSAKPPAGSVMRCSQNGHTCSSSHGRSVRRLCGSNTDMSAPPCHAASAHASMLA